MKLLGRLICWDREACEEAFRFLSQCELIATDIETVPFDKKKNNSSVFVITIITYSGIRRNGGIHSYCFPLQNGKSPTSGAPLEIETIFRTVAKINDLPNRFTLQNGVYDAAWFIRYGIPLRNYAYDSMSLWWSRYPDLPRRLDFIASVLLDDYQYWKESRKSDDFIEYCIYGMKDTESTLRATLKLLKMAEHDDRMRLNFFHAHMRSLAGLEMSMQGIAVDEEVMNEIAGSLDKEAVKALAELRYLVGDEGFNPNSPAQKKQLLYGILGARFRNAKGRFVKRVDDASTGAVVLRAMRADHPFFRRVANGIIDALTPSKQISNVVGLARFPGGSTGSRFLTSYDGVGTTTSRFSSRGSAFGHGGNAQNVRKKYRRFGRADVGHFLVEIDLSASDDVFVAFESQEPKKIELVRSGKDGHAVNATIFFTNWVYEDIVAGKKADDPRIVHPITGIRQITKKVVHGTHYLMAGLTLLNSAGRDAIVAAAIEGGHSDAGKWDQGRLVWYCEEMAHKFRLFYPRFQLEHDSPDSWYRELRAEVRKTGGFYTPFRYFQRFSADPNDDSTLRAVAATAGQAGTAGRINMVMDELCHGYMPPVFRDAPNPHYGDRPNRIGASLNGISVRLQTHDSITFDVNPMHSGWVEGLRGVFDCFNRPVIIHGEEVRVGIEADASIYWAGKEGLTFKRFEQLLERDSEGLDWVDRMGLKRAA